MIPTFPEFRQLTLDDLSDYNKIISKYPPYSNISFSGLQIWWNIDNELKVSFLNNNLVINYYQEFDLDNSGLSIIGESLLDESIDIIFEYLEARSGRIQLVHIPEFVVNKLPNKANYTITEEDGYHEYIYINSEIADLTGKLQGRLRRKVNRFLREQGEKDITIEELDLSSESNQNKLFSMMVNWQKQAKSNNDQENSEYAAFRRTLKYSKLLEIKCLIIKIDNEISGFVIYSQSVDKNYHIVHHLKVNYAYGYIFDFLTHAIAKKSVDNEVKYLNLEMDLGIENLRIHKERLHPHTLFKQFSITPHNQLIDDAGIINKN